MDISLLSNRGAPASPALSWRLSTLVTHHSYESCVVLSPLLLFAGSFPGFKIVSGHTQHTNRYCSTAPLRRLNCDELPCYVTLHNVTPRAPPIAPADLTMALASDTDRSKSSPLLRQILQPLPEAGEGEEVATGTEAGEGQGERGDGGGTGDGDDDDNDDNAGDDGESPNDNDDAVAENVVSIVDDMGLDENEAAALRLAIAGGDVNIRGALELFRCVGVAEYGMWVRGDGLPLCASVY